MRTLLLAVTLCTACGAPEGDNCETPFEVNSLPYDRHVDLGTMRPDMSFRDEAGPCVAVGQYGNDAVFAVELSKGQELVATATCAFDSASLYAIFDCDAPLSTVQCIDGDDGEPAGTALEISFTATSEDTYFVVVDHRSTATAAGAHPECDLHLGLL